MSKSDRCDARPRHGRERAATLTASLAMAAVLALILAPKAALEGLTVPPAHAEIGPVAWTIR